MSQLPVPRSPHIYGLYFFIDRSLHESSFLDLIFRSTIILIGIANRTGLFDANWAFDIFLSRRIAWKAYGINAYPYPGWFLINYYREDRFLLIILTA